VSRSSSASDLIRFARASLPGGAAGAAPGPNRYFARIATLQLFALLCAVTALGCALVALWIYAAPTLGAAGALLLDSLVLCVVGFAVFLFERRTRELRLRSSVPDLGADVLLAGGSSFVRRHTALTLVTGPRGRFLRRRKLGRRRGSLAEAGRSGMSSFRVCYWRLAVRIIASDTPAPMTYHQRENRRT
jgi:hypothetical protein